MVDLFVLAMEKLQVLLNMARILFRDYCHQQAKLCYYFKFTLDYYFRAIILKFLTTLRYIFTFIALLAIIAYCYGNVDGIYMLAGSIECNVLFVSILLLVVANYISPLLSVRILNHLKSPISYKAALLIHLSRLPSRYLPGGVWHTVSKIADYKSIGVTTANLAKLTTCEIFISLVAATFLALLLRLELTVVNLILVLIFISLVVSLCSISRIFKSYIVFAITYSPVWIGYSMSFAMYWNSFEIHDIASVSLNVVASNYLISWLIGYVSVFAPQGIGITEITFNFLQNIGGSHTKVDVTLIFSFRLVMLISDLISWASALLLKYARN